MAANDSAEWQHRPHLTGACKTGASKIYAVLTNVQIAVMGRVLATQTECMNVQVIGACKIRAWPCRELFLYAFAFACGDLWHRG